MKAPGEPPIENVIESVEPFLAPPPDPEKVVHHDWVDDVVVPMSQCSIDQCAETACYTGLMGRRVIRLCQGHAQMKTITEIIVEA